jgi:hypothetical protein
MKSSGVLDPFCPKITAILFAVTASIRLGTSSFTATGWNGSFYPSGVQSRDYLSFYAEHFDSVEVDSAFYACPSVNTVKEIAIHIFANAFYLLTLMIWKRLGIVPTVHPSVCQKPTHSR